MDKINLFRYQHKKSIIHLLDARIKLFIFVLNNLVCIHIHFVGLWVLACFLMLVFVLSQLSFKTLWNDIRAFFVFLFLVLLLSSLTNSEQAHIWLKLWYFSISLETLQYLLRLLLLLLASHLFIGTTTLGQISGVVAYFFRFVPFVNAHNMAFRVRFSLFLVQMLFDIAAEVREAQIVRNISLKVNYYKRTKYFLRAFVIKSIKKTQDISLSMEARCYNEGRTMPHFRLYGRDVLILLLAICFYGCLFCFFRG